MIDNKEIDNLTFSELWKEYDEYLKIKLKAQSYRKKSGNFKNHILPYFKDYLVKDINSKVYLNWMSKIDEKDLKFTFKSSLHFCLVSILNYAIKFYNLNDNIASKIGDFNKSKGQKKVFDFWTYEEYKKFITSVDNETYKLLFDVLYFTGMRIGECLALTWEDYKDNYFDINKTISKEKNKNGSYIINSPKTPASIRKISLDSEIVNSLNKLYHEEQRKIGFSDKWFIFGGKKPLSHTTVSRRKNKYCEISGIKKIRLHDFRHSHATLLLSLGVSPTILSQRLGHSDIAMTLNTYSHLIPQDYEKMINLINNLKLK